MTRRPPQRPPRRTSPARLGFAAVGLTTLCALLAPPSAALASTPAALGLLASDDVAVQMDADAASVAVGLPGAASLVVAASLGLPSDALGVAVGTRFRLTGDATAGVTAVLAAGVVAPLLQPGVALGLHPAIAAHWRGDVLQLAAIATLPSAVGWQSGALALRYGLSLDAVAAVGIGRWRVGLVGNVGAVGGGEAGVALRLGVGGLLGLRF